MSKGSAFAKFISPEEAAECVQSAKEIGGISIGDRKCLVDIAVDRDQAAKLKTAEDKGSDARNLYLANEGLVLDEKVVEDANGKKIPSKTSQLSLADKDKRERAQNAKRKQLTNPLFFVSAYRLSVRGLSKTIEEKDLRQVVQKAVKAGLTKMLVTDKDIEAHVKAQGSNADVYEKTTALSKTKYTLPPFVSKTCLRKVKIMLDIGRMRAGAPQSRGYAFVQFSNHAHALACLRELNNSRNPAYTKVATAAAEGGEAQGRLMLEFTMENIQKVKLQQSRDEQRVRYVAQHGAPVPGGVKGEKGKDAKGKDVKDVKKRKREQQEEEREEEKKKEEEEVQPKSDASASGKAQKVKKVQSFQQQQQIRQQEEAKKEAANATTTATTTTTTTAAVSKEGEEKGEKGKGSKKRKAGTAVVVEDVPVGMNGADGGKGSKGENGDKGNTDVTALKKQEKKTKENVVKAPTGDITAGAKGSVVEAKKQKRVHEGQGQGVAKAAKGDGRDTMKEGKEVGKGESQSREEGGANKEKVKYNNKGTSKAKGGKEAPARQKGSYGAKEKLVRAQIRAKKRGGGK